MLEAERAGDEDVVLTFRGFGITDHTEHGNSNE
jgi:hypothetical protein